MNNKISGAYGEKKAVKFLKKRGYKIVAKNFRGKQGEIDIIAEKKRKQLVFVEVKYRATEGFGLPEEAVDIKKQKRIIDTAKYFLLKNDKYEDYEISFAVISILNENIDYIEDAFWEV